MRVLCISETIHPLVNYHTLSIITLPSRYLLYYLFGGMVMFFSAVRFSIYSTVWIRPYVEVPLIVVVLGITEFVFQTVLGDLGFMSKN